MERTIKAYSGKLYQSEATCFVGCGLQLMDETTQLATSQQSYSQLYIPFQAPLLRYELLQRAR